VHWDNIRTMMKNACELREDICGKYFSVESLQFVEYDALTREWETIKEDWFDGTESKETRWLDYTCRSTAMQTCHFHILFVLGRDSNEPCIWHNGVTWLTAFLWVWVMSSFRECGSCWRVACWRFVTRLAWFVAKVPSVQNVDESDFRVCAGHVGAWGLQDSSGDRLRWPLLRVSPVATSPSCAVFWSGGVFWLRLSSFHMGMYTNKHFISVSYNRNYDQWIELNQSGHRGNRNISICVAPNKNMLIPLQVGSLQVLPLGWDVLWHNKRFHSLVSSTTLFFPFVLIFCLFYKCVHEDVIVSLATIHLVTSVYVAHSLRSPIIPSDRNNLQIKGLMDKILFIFIQTLQMLTEAICIDHNVPKRIRVQGWEMCVQG
jgi:hypothetical protein